MTNTLQAESLSQDPKQALFLITLVPRRIEFFFSSCITNGGTLSGKRGTLTVRGKRRDSFRIEKRFLYGIEVALTSPQDKPSLKHHLLLFSGW